MDPFIAEIVMFGGNFAPRSWALCDGQLLPISSNTALFSLIGTIYGGDGRTTMALPDMRGRTPIHPGNGPGLSSYRLGQRGGGEYNYLNVTQLPSHDHTAVGKVKASSVDGTTNLANGAYPATAKVAIDRSNVVDASIYGAAANEFMAADSVEVTVGNTGGGQAVNNMQPWLAVNFIIALQGIFPSRN